MTAVEDLRKAADILCARATAAQPGPWKVGPEIQGDKDIYGAKGEKVCQSGVDWPTTLTADAEWIVLVNPLLAFSLAAMLQQAAQNAETLLTSWGGTDPEKFVEPNALQLARIIINTDITIKAAQEAP